ncbi:MAG: signal peptidase I [Candidatus Sericytochromatia bacterium]|nr:signal peptidase I [Candidatus Sericytochromatia bacterium]
MSDTSQTQPKTKRKSRTALGETVETILVAGILAIGIRATVAEARSIPSESMVPTLLIGDHLIVEKVTSYYRSPTRGEVLVFYPPHPDVTLSASQRALRALSLTADMALIKRVVALGGERIAVREGKVFINGIVLQEPYIQAPPSYTMPERMIPPDSVFMMGDNRNNSLDSHIWGPLPVKNVIGHAVFRFWPVNRMGPLTTPQAPAASATPVLGPAT